MERIVIIGCPGSGKSTFARILAGIEYADDRIRIKTPGKILCLNGERLSINSITDSDILIEGKFYNMGWE